MVSLDLFSLGPQLRLNCAQALLQIPNFLLVADDHLLVHREQRQLRLLELFVLLQQRIHRDALLVEVERLGLMLRLQLHVVSLELLVHLEQLRVCGVREVQLELVVLLAELEDLALLFLRVLLVILYLLLLLCVLCFEPVVLLSEVLDEG